MQRLKSSSNHLRNFVDSDRDPIAPCLEQTGHSQASYRAEFKKALASLSLKAKANPFTIFLASIKALLFRYANSDNFVVCVSIANHQIVGTKATKEAGFWVLHINTSFSGEPSFLELVGRVDVALAKAYADRGTVGQGDIDDLLSPGFDLHTAGQFSLNLGLQGFPKKRCQDHIVVSTQDSGPSEESPVDISLSVRCSTEGWVVSADYCVDEFDLGLVNQFLQHLGVIVEDVAADPEQTISTISMLTPEERHRFLVEWNETERDYARGKLTHQLFEEQVERTPGAVAVDFEGESLTYADLNARANQLAHHLQTLGVGPNTLVGICVHRCLETIVGILGTLKAGAAYVPIDPTIPMNRLDYIISDAKIAVLLSHSQILYRHGHSTALIINLDCFQGSGECGNLVTNVNAENFAYLIYTSGSTGTPKGVLVTHGNLLHTTVARFMNYPESVKRFLLLSSFTFDSSVAGVFWTLAQGGTLFVTASLDVIGIPELRRLISKHEISHLLAIPSLYAALLRDAEPTELQSLRSVIVAGESCPAKLVNAHYAKVRSPLFNEYGPTETSVWSTVHKCHPQALETAVPIGHPIANTRIYLLDKHLQLVPIGVQGEIFIGGDGVAYGYLNDPKSTAERFLPDPFSKSRSDRIYRTGDLARYWNDGTIEHLGRLDHQVKLRGHRIELEEIEAVLFEHVAVSGAAVIVHGERADDQRLSAYVVADRDRVTPQEMRDHLKGRLPAYMIPTTISFLDQLPLTSNGKLDRKSLAARGDSHQEYEPHFTPPLTPLEESLAAIWCEVLHLDRVSVREEFLHLGGHSLKAMRIASQMTSLLGIEVPVSWVFEYPTIESLSEKVQSQKGEVSRIRSIERSDRHQSLPLSYGQQRLWLVQQTLADLATYNESVAWRFVGKIDPDRVQNALMKISERHEVLRSALIESDGNLVQKIFEARTVELPWRYVDLQSAESSRRQSEIELCLAAEIRRPFELNDAPLWRATLLSLANDDHVLVFTFHHSIIDEWSLRLFVEELGQIYSADGKSEQAILPELPVQYADYSTWQRRIWSGDQLERHTDYWQQQLADLPSAFQFPTDRLRRAQPSDQGAVHHFRMQGPVVTNLRRLAKNEDTTVFSVLLASFQVFLYRYSGQTDFVVGTPLANRRHPEVQYLIGYFLNTIPIRSHINGNNSYREMLHQLRRTLKDAFSHADLPFERMVELAIKDRQPGCQTIYQTMFVLLEEKIASPNFSSVQGESVFVHTGTSKNDLTLEIHAIEDDWTCRFEYSSDLFSGETVARMAEHFTELVNSIAEDPDAAIRHLDLMNDKEQKQILIEWNQNECDYLREKSVHQLFEEQVERTPNSPAVVMDGQRLTYQELNDQANRLAHHLRSFGMASDRLIGLCVDRSVELVVSMLAILKSGAAYLPLDPEYPAERLAQILIDSGASAVVTEERFLSILPTDCVSAVYIDSDAANWAEASTENPLPTLKPDQLAYVIYTSGSTGTPKGVEIPHRAIVNFLQFTEKCPGLASGEVVLAQAPVTFDISVFEIFQPLICGGAVELVSRAVATDGFRLRQALEHSAATMMVATTLTWRMLLESGWAGNKSLRILCGGEAMTPDLAHALLSRGESVWNMYGPTETTVWSTVRKIEGGSERISIGRPIANTRVYILDEHLQPTPVGVPGELYLGGDGVARGYRSRPDLTAQRFVVDPFHKASSARMYRTGDLARYLSDGTIEHLGRLDHQVKLRGHRIELEEIESVLFEHADVSGAAVTVHGDRADNQRLAAFVVADRDRVTPQELRDYLKSRLPSYMIPATISFLDQLPLTSNGKLDRKSLPAPQASSQQFETLFTAPRTPLEASLAAIWCELLNLDRVGTNENFFQLGGHSLLAMRVASQLMRLLGRDIPVRWVFEYPTIGDLAEKLAGMADPLEQPDLISRVSRVEPLPMSFAQQGIWQLQQILPEPAAYHVLLALRISGRLDRPRCLRALKCIAQRHEVLRTALVLRGEKLVQQISSDDTFELPWREVSLRSLLSDGDSTLRERLLTLVRQPFDLTQAPLWRVLWVDLADDEQVMAFTFHHSITDEASLRLFVEELNQLYLTDGQLDQARLPELPVQYADYAAWQRQTLSGALLQRQCEYWKEQLRDLPPGLELPADFSPSQLSGRGAVHDFRLEGPVVCKLRELGRQEGATLFNVMLCVFQVWLHRYTHESDLVVGTPITNRQRPELQHLLGFFLNTLPIRVRFTDNLGFLEVLHQVRGTLWKAMSHSELPFEQIVQMVVKERELGHQPLCRVMFVLLEDAIPLWPLDGAEIHHLPLNTGTSKYDLTLSIEAANDVLACQLEYRSELFEAATVERMASQITQLVHSITSEPGLPVSRLNLLSAVERSQIVQGWNQTDRDYPIDKCLHQLFEEQVERTPNAIAVEFDGQTLTYKELNERANQLAHYLRALGVGHDVMIGVYALRSLEMVVGLLGVLKAGGAYVPIDPDYPAERVQYMIADAATPVLLTQRRLIESLPIHSALVFCLDSDWGSLSGFSNLNPTTDLASSSLAYMIYTSGSTGKPKGAMNAHRGIVNRLLWMQEEYQITSNDVVIQKTPFSFDVSVWEFFWPLINGARLLVAIPGGHKDVSYLVRSIRLHGITVMHFVPSMLALFLESPEIEKCNSIQHLFCSGEELGCELQNKVFARLDVQLHNLYGPTEAAVDVTHWTCRRDCKLPFVPIGRPVANTQCYILDAHQQPVPVGVAGELYLGGVQVGVGYHNRIETTSERFIPDLFKADVNARLYKTGDRCRYLADGAIQFLGRLDHQVKLRGQRIELQEIESVLLEHRAVSAAAVTVHAERVDDQRLSAFVVADRGRVTSNELRDYLKTRLPAYMIPATISFLDQLPLTSNGKLDRKSLPAPQASSQQTLFTAPRTALEESLAAIWCELLNLDRVGTNENFFQLGGHSLLAMRLAARISSVLNWSVPVALFFKCQTIAELAQHLNAANESVIVRLREGNEQSPVFLFPPIGGELIAFRDVVPTLQTKRALYGVDWHVGQDGLRERSMKDLAQYCVAEIQRVQPRGPYCLCGYSFGGRLAFETAGLLLDAGEQIQCLTLIDADTSSVPELTWRKRLIGIGGFVRKILVNIYHRLFTGFPVELSDLDQVSATIQLRRNADQFADAHFQPRLLPINVTVISAQTRVPGVSTFPDLGWSQCVMGRVEIKEVSGNHVSILHEPNVHELSVKLDEAFERASSSTEIPSSPNLKIQRFGAVLRS